MPTPWAHGLVLDFLDRLTRLPKGYKVVEWLGHMAPASGLRVQPGGRLSLCSPVGFTSVLDPCGTASRAFGRFGVGWLTVGPVGLAVGTKIEAEREDKTQSLIRRKPGKAALGIDAAMALVDKSTSDVCVFFELTSTGTDLDDALEELQTLMHGLAGASVFVLSPEIFTLFTQASTAARDAAFETLAKQAEESGAMVLLGAPVDHPDPALWVAAQKAGIAGAYFSGVVQGDEIAWSAGAWPKSLDTVKQIRSHLAPPFIVAVDGGVHFPRQCVQLGEAGADLIGLSSGLVHTGPGLAKRCNEALMTRVPVKPDEESLPAERMSWLWALSATSTTSTSHRCTSDWPCSPRGCG